MGGGAQSTRGKEGGVGCGQQWGRHHAELVFLAAIGEGRESGRFVSLTGAERTVSYAVPRDREELHDRIATGELKYVIPNTGIQMVKPAHLRENMDPRAVRVAHMIDFDGGDAATGCFICGRCEDASYCYLRQLHWHFFCMDNVDLEVANAVFEQLLGKFGGDECLIGFADMFSRLSPWCQGGLCPWCEAWVMYADRPS